MITRRDFIKVTGTHALAAGLLVESASTVGAAPLGIPIGSQTWPHRAMIKAGNFAGLLAELKTIGVQAIELCSPIDYEEFASLKDGKATRKLVADQGLTCTSAHFGMDEL